MRIRKIPLGTGLIVSLVAASGCLWLLAEDDSQPQRQGTVQGQEVRRGSRSGGRVAQVLVREGGLCQAGQALVYLEAPELEAQRGQWLARVQALTAVLQRKRRGARAEER